MITVRAPLRLCLAGGGSDCAAYWRSGHQGFVVTATISLSLTVKVEIGNRLNTCPQLRYAKAAGWGDYDLVQIESDVPSGSGLGGSGSLMVALLKARYHDMTKYELAQAAYSLERYSLHNPIGYQDCYAAAYGGSMALTIDEGGHVRVDPVWLPARFGATLLLMGTGIQREAGQVLGEQAACILSGGSAGLMEEIAAIGREIYQDLLENEGRRFGELTDLHWQKKRATTRMMSNPAIDAWYALAREKGASGAKVCGAGGGGYFLFVVEPPNRQNLVETMTAAGLVETPFQFTNEGARIVQ